MTLPTEHLLTALPGWLIGQRWFAGKGRPIDTVSVSSHVELIAGDPALHHLIVDVRQDGSSDRYQLLIGVRRSLPSRLEYAEITVAPDGPHLYDAVHDPELTRVLPARMADESPAGPVVFRHVPGVEIDSSLRSLASPAEQSNTSLVYGDRYICKLFRRVSPGVNPDLEISLGLAGLGSEYIPSLYGWAETELAGEPTTLAMMSEFLRTAVDGWQAATTSVRDLYAEPGQPAAEAGGDFAAEAERLGAATATVHRELARVFGVEEMPAERLRATADGMREQLARGCAAVPELAPFAAGIGAAFDDLARHDRPVPVQRVHGDYHLGQVMRTERGWVLLDFEGEPARPLAERRAPAHPLRDVAGMLRSFEYAARYLLAGSQAVAPATADRLEGCAREWAARSRTAFCRGYVMAGGPDPAADPVLIRAFEFDKAVYEVLYEARNRPAWLRVPLGSLARLIG